MPMVIGCYASTVSVLLYCTKVWLLTVRLQMKIDDMK